MFIDYISKYATQTKIHGVSSNFSTKSRRSLPTIPGFPNFPHKSGFEASESSHHLQPLARAECPYLQRRIFDSRGFLSLPCVFALSPTLLELYFCFISPYSNPALSLFLYVLLASLFLSLCNKLLFYNIVKF